MSEVNSDGGINKYASLPSNSSTQKTKAEREYEENSKPLTKISANEEDNKHDVAKVTSSKRQKKPLGTRFKETFLSEESDSVWSYVFWDILVPSAKETVSDLVTGAINILLFGDAGARKSNGRKKVLNGGYHDYSVSSSISHRSDNNERRYGRRIKRSLDDYVIENRKAAAVVISDMRDLIEDYGRCSVADYLGMIDQPWESTDTNWGWTDLPDLRPRPVKGGYVIDLPDIEPI